MVGTFRSKMEDMLDVGLREPKARRADISSQVF